MGAPNTSIGPVAVLNGQSVTFKAANYIDIEPGFFIETGADFFEFIEPCDNLNAQNDLDPSSVFFDADIEFSNPIVPWQMYCAGGTQYLVRIFENWGQMIYENTEFITTNQTILWDGYCNAGGCIGDIYQPNGIDDWLAYYVYIYDCSGEHFYEGTLDVVARLISSNNLSPAFKIEPTPCQNNFRISISNSDVLYSYFITNILGEVVDFGKIENDQLDINAGNWIPGIYNVKIINDETLESKVFKQIKQ